MKRAIVTGGTRGIGLATVKLLAGEGYAVTALYSQDEEGARSARQALPEVEFLKADVADMGALHSVFSRFSTLDVLVCNAGVGLFKQVQDTTEEEFSRLVNVNLGGVFRCCSLAVKKMLEKGGAIVNVSSVWGETGASCESVYSATKGGVIAFTKSLAKELAPAFITVNCVCPGVIDTAMNARLNESERAALKEEIPLGRFGTPEEVASSILFLIKHPYVTGQVLSVNGGFHI